MPDIKSVKKKVRDLAESLKQDDKVKMSDPEFSKYGRHNDLRVQEIADDLKVDHYRNIAPSSPGLAREIDDIYKESRAKRRREQK
jgi:hypothetical protein